MHEFQGDNPTGPLSNGNGAQPLIRRLVGIARQIWYADDSAAGSSIRRKTQGVVGSFERDWSFVWLFSEQLQDLHYNTGPE